MKPFTITILVLATITACKNKETPPLSTPPSIRDTIVIQTGSAQSKPVPSNLAQSGSANPAKLPKSKSIVVKSPPKDTVFYQGVNGGCYYLSNKGNKVYIDKTRCGSLPLSKPSIVVKQAPKPQAKKTIKSNIIKKKTESRTYITGKRGGCYYINSNGNKTYVDKSFCQ